MFLRRGSWRNERNYGAMGAASPGQTSRREIPGPVGPAGTILRAPALAGDKVIEAVDGLLQGEGLDPSRTSGPQNLFHASHPSPRKCTMTLATRTPTLWRSCRRLSYPALSASFGSSTETQRKSSSCSTCALQTKGPAS